MYLDFHTHPWKDQRADVRSMWALDPKDRDWLPEAEYCCVGLHPWFLTEQNAEAGFEWVERMAPLPQVVAIGETGLDRLRGPNLIDQRNIFERHVRLAESLDKAVVIHAVRSFDELLGLRRSWRPRTPWIVHGFAKGPEIAHGLIAAGCWLSFGKALFAPAETPILQAFRNMPDDRFLLETDGDPAVDIGDVYRRAAELRGCSLEWLEERLSQNVREVLAGKMG
jgi:TatD DNase family protein